MTDSRRSVAKGLASAFLAGKWDPPAMTHRGQRAVGQRRVWVRELALATRHAYPLPPSDAHHELAQFLAVCPPFTDAFVRAKERGEPEPKIERLFVAPTSMGERRWPVTPMDSVKDLQNLFGLSESKLEWFADPKQLGRKLTSEHLSHYQYRWMAKQAGGARLIEEPKSLLKHFQRVVLTEILNFVPPHPAAHGFRKGRSALTYAAEHVGQAVIFHLDLEDFFGSIVAGRVFGIFRSCGYPEQVAHLLTGIITNSTPRSVLDVAPRSTKSDSWSDYRRLCQRLAHPHLPQGAPSSPATANLVSFHLDRRLSALAFSGGLNYTRYADDIAFSSSGRMGNSSIKRLVRLIAQIASEEGFRINNKKTFLKRSSQRQRLAGVVVNERPNIERREYDRLKAILNNAARHGPASQSRDNDPHFRAQLLGRISWINHLNPQRGLRLQVVFAQIDWRDYDT